MTRWLNLSTRGQPEKRSDEIRQRRRVKVHKPAPTAAPPVRTTRRVDHRIPPVMMRGAAASFPAHKVETRQTAQKMRRRYDVALGATGAEVRLPSMPRVHVGWRLLSFLLTGALAALLYLAWTSPVLQVSAAQVSGLQRLSSRDVNAVLGVSNKPVFTLDPSILERSLQSAFPEFSSVKASVLLPATVLITVTERVPVLAWKQAGRTELVDASGVAFPVRDGLQGSATPPVVVEASSSPPLLEPLPTPGAGGVTSGTPLLPGSQPAVSHRLLTAEMVKSILEMSAQVPENTSILYDAERGLGWKDPGGWDVYFGDSTDMQMKLYVYAALVKQLKKDAQKPVMISVAQEHAPYYRLPR